MEKNSQRTNDLPEKVRDILKKLSPDDAKTLRDILLQNHGVDALQNVAEAKGLEDSQKEKDCTFKAIVDNAEDFIFIKDINRRYTFVNRAMQKLLETQTNEILHRTPDEVFGSEQEHIIKSIDNRTFSGETVNETRSLQINGEEIFFNTLQSPLSIKDGEVTSIMGVVRDVTENERTEMALREESEFRKQILAEAPVGVTIYDAVSGQCIAANKAMAKLVGATEEQVLAQNLFTIATWNESGLLDTARSALKDKEKKQIDVDLTTTFGRDVSFQCYFVPFVAGDKKYLLLTLNDLTERKNAQKILHQYKHIVSSSTDMLALLDQQFHYFAANNAYLEAFELDPEQIIGMTVAEVFGEKFFETVIKPHAIRCLGGEEVNYQDWFDFPAQRRRYMHVTYFPYYNEDNEIMGFVANGRDITEQNRTQEELQKIQKLESLGILAGGIAHDFNNLLSGIFGYIDLAHALSQDDRVSNYLSKTFPAIDRARNLTRQLLTFAKGGAPVRKASQLFPLIQETAQFALSGSSVSCVFNIPNDLWICSFDKNQIATVIDNLVINAHQAMPAGGTMELSAINTSLGDAEHATLSSGDYVKISFIDQGIGIPEDILLRIFDPFFTTKAKGHGLGLSTCFSIVNRHGGCIDVESEPGKGSSFHVYLPASHEISPSREKQATLKHKGRGTILVMDDEEIIREMVGTMLESLGYSVVCKDNGKDAIGYLSARIQSNQKITAMILDLTVAGGMGGKEAITKIRELDPTMPVFVASGYAEDEVIAHPSDYGFTASLTKPFRMAELVSVLDNFINN